MCEGGIGLVVLTPVRVTLIFDFATGGAAGGCGEAAAGWAGGGVGATGGGAVVEDGNGAIFFRMKLGT